MFLCCASFARVCSLRFGIASGVGILDNLRGHPTGSLSFGVLYLYDALPKERLARECDGKWEPLKKVDSRFLILRVMNEVICVCPVPRSVGKVRYL